MSRDSKYDPSLTKYNEADEYTSVFESSTGGVSAGYQVSI
jgi:hypothetical protein